QTAAREPGSRRRELPVLGRPHLMLTDAGRDDRIFQSAALLDDLPEPLDGVLGHDGVGAIAVLERLLLAPKVDLPLPFGIMTGLGNQTGIGVDHLDQAA